MNKLLLALAFLMMSSSGFSMEKIDSRYLVSYGDQNASIKVVKYYSFMCPHCLELFRREFAEVKSRYLETNAIEYTFHPVPKDLLTVCAMDCLDKLSAVHKKAFLEVMLEEIDIENSEFSIGLMKKAMEILEHPIPQLSEKDYLQNTQAFKDAFAFLSQEEVISAVPTVEVNGRLFPKEIPNIKFIDRVVQELATEKKHVD